MTSEHLPPPLESSLAVVREWLDKITAASTNPELDLRNLRAVLTHLPEIVEQDPTIDAAVDNLADAASAYLKEVELAAGHRDDVQIRLGREPLVQADFLPTKVSAPRQGPKIEKAEVDGLLDLVDILTSQENP